MQTSKSKQNLKIKASKTTKKKRSRVLDPDKSKTATASKVKQIRNANNSLRTVSHQANKSHAKPSQVRLSLNKKM